MSARNLPVAVDVIDLDLTEAVDDARQVQAKADKIAGDLHALAAFISRNPQLADMLGSSLSEQRTYVRKREQVAAFVDFALENAASVAGDVGLVQLPKDRADAAVKAWETFTADASTAKDAKTTATTEGDA